jgi:hypothetical protein
VLAVVFGAVAIRARKELNESSETDGWIDKVKLVRDHIFILLLLNMQASFHSKLT